MPIKHWSLLCWTCSHLVVGHCSILLWPHKHHFKLGEAMLSWPFKTLPGSRALMKFCVWCQLTCERERSEILCLRQYHEILYQAKMLHIKIKHLLQTPYTTQTNTSKGIWTVFAYPCTALLENQLFCTYWHEYKDSISNVGYWGLP